MDITGRSLVDDGPLFLPVHRRSYFNCLANIPGKSACFRMSRFVTNSYESMLRMVRKQRRLIAPGVVCDCGSSLRSQRCRCVLYVPRPCKPGSLLLFKTRFYDPPNVLLPFECMLSFSMPILASDEMMQPSKCSGVI